MGALGAGAGWRRESEPKFEPKSEPEPYTA